MAQLVAKKWWAATIILVALMAMHRAYGTPWTLMAAFWVALYLAGQLIQRRR